MFPDLFRDDVFRIETRRLWLRWPTARDVPAIQRLAGDPAVAGMTARIPHPLAREPIDAFVLGARSANASGAALTLAVCERARPGALIGVVAIEGRDGFDTPHLGYWLGRPYWGAGLATEAVRALIHAWFAWAGGTCLASSALCVNPASRRVLEKAGFAWTGRGLAPCPARGGAREVDRFQLERAGPGAPALAAGDALIAS